MTSLYMLATFLLGCILGSFLNAVLFRFNTGKSALKGRSRCMRCGHTLHAVDLVPVVSYLLLRGRCRYCGSRVSWQYPLVELVGGLLSVSLFVLFYSQPVWYLFWLVVWLVVLFIVVYDIRHMIIPWSASLPLVGLAIGFVVVQSISTLPTINWMVLAAGPLLAFPLFFISLISRGRWMGWADSLFELSLGWLLGLTQGFTALMLSIWLGAAVGIAVLLLTKRVTMKSEIPFAPFLALGAAISFFLHVDFFSTLPLLFL